MKPRAAQTSDYKAILSLCKELSSNFNEDTLKKSFPKVIDDKNARIFVVEISTQIIGFIEIHLLHSLQSGDHAMIRALFVSEPYRRSGHALALVELAEKWATSKGADKILVQSKTQRAVAERFYLKSGYTKFKVQNVFKKTLIT